MGAVWHALPTILLMSQPVVFFWPWDQLITAWPVKVGVDIAPLHWPPVLHYFGQYGSLAFSIYTKPLYWSRDLDQPPEEQLTSWWWWCRVVRWSRRERTNRFSDVYGMKPPSTCLLASRTALSPYSKIAHLSTDSQASFKHNLHETFLQNNSESWWMPKPARPYCIFWHQADFFKILPSL